MQLRGDTMNVGDLIFVRGTGFVSRMIKWVTKSEYSHSAIFVGDGTLIEAEAFRRVGFQELDAYYGHYDVVPLNASVDAVEIRNGLLWLMNQRGKKYSYWTDVLILIRCLFGLRLRGPFRDRNNTICSRLARDFLFKCGVPIPNQDMSPEDLYEWLNKYQKGA